MYQITKTVKKHYPNIPYFLMGHSMGSMFSQRYAMRYGKEIDGLILTGIVCVDRHLIIPGKILCKIISVIKGERYRSKLFNNLVFGQFLKKIPNHKTEYDWLTTDEDRVNDFINDEKCGFGFTMNGFEALLSTLGYIQNERHIAKIPKDLKVLMISGSEDPCGNYGKYIDELFASYKNQGIHSVSKKLYEGCRHELVNEKIKDKICEDIERWVKI